MSRLAVQSLWATESVLAMDSLPIGGRALAMVGHSVPIALGGLCLWLDPTGRVLGLPDATGTTIPNLTPVPDW
jgi:hypothetical protein